MLRRSFFFIFMVLLLITCKKDENQTVIDADFQLYVNRFVTEAHARGVNVDISKLKAIYSDTLNYYCGYGEYAVHQVQISSRAGCWANQSDINKEILMFHEMGHAILGRSHDNSKLPNGDFKTMMFGGNQFGLYSEDTPERRTYYLDELFNPSTPPPGWSAAKTIPTILFSDSIRVGNTSWVFHANANSHQTGEVSSDHFVSLGHSLEIFSPDQSAFSAWNYTFVPQGIAEGDRLELTVKIRLENVTGNGVFFGLTGGKGSENTFFATTQGSTSIVGTSDFIEYRVQQLYYVTATQVIHLFLGLDGTSAGKVYFDDITVTKYE